MRNVLFSIAFGLVILTGCVSTSIYPFYSEKDVVAVPELIGTWQNALNDDAETWTFEKAGPKALKLVVTEADKKSEYDVHVFQLHGRKYFDFMTRDRHEHCAPLHAVARLVEVKPTLKFTVLSPEFIAKRLEKNPSELRHVRVPDPDKSNEPHLVLTAETADLQKFLVRNETVVEAYGDVLEYKRK